MDPPYASYPCAGKGYVTIEKEPSRCATASTIADVSLVGSTVGSCISQPKSVSSCSGCPSNLSPSAVSETDLGGR